jgi:hypothetical protein
MGKHIRLTVAQREAIYQGKLNGRTLKELASEIGCSYFCARNWWRVGRKRGSEGLGHRRKSPTPQTPLSSFDPRVAERALELKRQHPRRGPTRILIELAKDESLRQLQLPKRSQLAAYWRMVCPELLAKRQVPPPAPPRARQTHDLWQLDSKECIRLQDGTISTVLDVREPVACIWLGLFAHTTQTKKGWRKLTLAETQSDLRQVFTRYGLPRGIQTDREHLYGQPAAEAFPTTFTLWLVGLGIEHHFSRSSRPTDQAQVERGHRTWHDWIFEPQPHPDLKTLQARLDEARQTHILELPSRAGDCNGHTPLKAHPEVNHVWRPYHLAAERELFSLEGVDRFLAQFVWQYKVTKSCQVMIHGYAYYIGPAHAGQPVDVRFHSMDRCFVFSDASSGAEIKRLPARYLDAETIMGLPDSLPTLSVPLQLSFPT